MSGHSLFQGLFTGMNTSLCVPIVVFCVSILTMHACHATELACIRETLLLDSSLDLQGGHVGPLALMKSEIFVEKLCKVSYCALVKVVNTVIFSEKMAFLGYGISF